MQHSEQSQLRPVMAISAEQGTARRGTPAVAAAVAGQLAGKAAYTVAVECYPGVDQAEVLALFAGVPFDLVLHAEDAAWEPEKLDAALARDMTADRVFGLMTNRVLADYFYPEKLALARQNAAAARRVLVYGVGATLITAGDILCYADITRWEIQLRYRRGLANWRTAQTELPRLAKYKRGYFAEWRWADLVKKSSLPAMALYLDMTTAGQPACLSGAEYRQALAALARRPVRMVPYYDPGVWGGHWMKDHFCLPENGSNYAWSFDGVPEENSLLLGFGEVAVETPAVNLVFSQPRALLGERVYARFGAEFPIRFDLLDTIGGQNLSLQVHPLTEYIQDAFHMHYTQDESYYILDTAEPDPHVWLGLCAGCDREAMAAGLYAAQRGEAPFPAGDFVNKFPVKKHDHVLIPAGTVHGAGAGTMVLEVSATPYIFTFKLWDWGRVDLDGKPRPIHLDRGLANIQWERDTTWVKAHLLGQDKPIYSGDNGLVERTGLDEREFIDTYRLTTAGTLPVQRNGSVHMLNLVEGDAATITSPENRFAPFTVRYAQTFFLPEAAGDYEIAAPGGAPVKVILACVRG